MRIPLLRGLRKFEKLADIEVMFLLVAFVMYFSHSLSILAVGSKDREAELSMACSRVRFVIVVWIRVMDFS